MSLYIALSIVSGHAGAEHSYKAQGQAKSHSQRIIESFRFEKPTKIIEYNIPPALPCSPLHPTLKSLHVFHTLNVWKWIKG